MCYSKIKEEQSMTHEEKLKRLSAAIASEWLSYYSYWYGSIVAIGPMYESISKHFEEHAEEEKEHADKLVARLYELGGLPPFDFSELTSISSCPYPMYEDNNECVRVLVKQQRNAEACAVANYEAFIDALGDTDAVTTDLLTSILATEYEHLTDMKKAVKSLEEA
jgi:bacterioferritin